MKQTKIAGLGVIVMVVVALAGCDLFGDSRGPGFGYVPLRPPVEESVAGTSLSTNTIAQSVGVLNVIQSSTPEEQAIAEYNRLRGALDSVDSEMSSLDSRAQEAGDRPCLESNLSEITLTIPDMGDSETSLTAQIQCAEIRTGGGADYLAVYFGFDDSGDESVFYLIEMQELTDDRGGPVQMHHVRYASRNLATDEVIFRQITMHDEGVADEPTLSVAWNLEVTSIIARPNAEADEKFILYSVRELENDSIDVTIAHNSTDPFITAGTADGPDNTTFSVNNKHGAAVALIESVRNRQNGLSVIAPF